MNRPTVLIGGGYDKDSTYEEWINAFEGKVKKLVLLGATREKIADTARRLGFEDIVMADTFEEAFEKCVEYSRPEMRYCCHRRAQAGECLKIMKNAEINSKNL